MAPLFDDDSERSTVSSDTESERGCWYLPCDAGDKSLFALVDCGASVSLVAKSVFDEIPREAKTLLKSSGHQLKNADGRPMAVLGESELSLRVGKVQYIVKVQVAESLGHLSALFGMDLLSKK